MRTVVDQPLRRVALSSLQWRQSPCVWAPAELGDVERIDWVQLLVLATVGQLGLEVCPRMKRPMLC